MESWYYTREGQQLGPVDRQQLQALAARGELDRVKDLVWNETMPGWLPAGQVAELFAPAPPQGGRSAAPPALELSNPYATPDSAWSVSLLPEGAHSMGLPEIEPGSEPFDVMAVLKRGFHLTARHFGFIVLLGIVYIAISVVLSLALFAMDAALGWGGTNGFTLDSMAQSNGSLLNHILSNLGSIYLSIGVTRIGLNLVSGKPVAMNQLFGEAPLFLRAVVAHILFIILFCLGLLALIVPAIYVALRYGQFLTAMVDRNMGIMESFEYSSRITTNNRGNLFGLAMMSILVVIAGMLALLVGLAFAYPVVWLAGTAAYRWMQYGRRATEDHPGTVTPMLA